MVHNKIQFAVVREDPEIEIDLLKDLNAKKILLIGSGGCTALSIQSQFPLLKLCILDPNTSQINLLKEKIKALQTLSPSDTKMRLNVGNDHPEGLNQCGNFESLFRGLRNFIQDFVISKDDLQQMFLQKSGREDTLKMIRSNKFWPSGFKMFFHDSLLEAMFGPEATQNAVPGSYPDYFQNCFEKGLSSDSAYSNYFLHHLLLGHYIDSPECLPKYMTDPPKDFNFDFINGYFESAPNLEAFNLVQLSNIFDWMSDAEINKIADRLKKELKSGSKILIRQLNNNRDFKQLFQSEFEFDDSYDFNLLKNDRSLFYMKLMVGTKK